MSDLVSVVIPVYNAEKYLESCIDSVIRQTYNNLEIILVDDGSSDSSPDICDKYATMDSRIKVIHQINMGLSFAREKGFDSSTGTIVSFMDNDDLIHPAFFETLICYMKDGVDIVSAGRVDLSNQNIENYKWELFCDNKVFCTTGEYACSHMDSIEENGIVLPFWGKIFRREVLERLDFSCYKKACPTIFFEDILMTPFYLLAAGQIIGIQIPMYIHREVPTSVSRSGKLSSFYYEQIDSGEIVLNFFKNNQFTDMYRLQLKTYINTLLRIWYLIQFTDLDKISQENFKKVIEERFIRYYNEYLAKGKAKLIEKISAVIFYIKPGIWKRVCGDIYWKEQRGKS